MISPIQADLTLLLFALGMREIAPSELPDLFETIASRGLDNETFYARGTYKGLSAAEMHYRKHVVDNREWPATTTFEEYSESAAGVIRRPRYAFTCLYKQRYIQTTFVGPSELMRGEGGHHFIMVEYRLGHGHWTTVYLPDMDRIEDLVNHADRSTVLWIYPK